MVFRKRTEIEKKVERLKKEIEQLNIEIDRDSKKKNEYSEKGEEGKALQRKTRRGINIDKRNILQDRLDNISVETMPLESPGLEAYNEETVRKFYNWLKSNDIDYFNYLRLRDEAPDLFKEMMNKFTPKEGLEDTKVEQVIKRIIIKRIINKYCEEHNLKLINKAGEK